MFQEEFLFVWTECILATVYLINRLPLSVLNGKSPYELVYNSLPSLVRLRSFGYLCFSKVLNDSYKFVSSEKCVLIGYSSSSKGYKLWSMDNKCVVFFKRCSLL